MKLLKSLYKSLLLGAIALIAPAVAGLSLTSCNGVIYDDLDPCPEGVRLRFVYDYNMEFANAFTSQVDCLTVLVYNEDGSFREKRTVTDRALLSDENWRMDIDLPEGRYMIVAYGGLADDDASYHFVKTPAEGTVLTDNRVELNPEIMNRSQGTNLHTLFWGATIEKDDFDSVKESSQAMMVEVKKTTMAYENYTVYMMRDTNNLRIVLQEINGDPLSDKLFNFDVVDDNTLMGWNNAVIPSTPFSYNAWTTGQAAAGILPDGSESQVAFAEFSFGRIMMDNQPMLHVTRVSDGSDVINIPLINYLLLAKSEDYLKMPSQEYLDREHHWNFTFFLDKHWKWIQVQIQVADWVVRVNNPELTN